MGFRGQFAFVSPNCQGSTFTENLLRAQVPKGDALCITQFVFQIRRRWRLIMPQFLCASLSSLTKQLLERYDVRSKMILRNLPDAELSMAEREIIRINRLITRHRRQCSQCKARESLLKFSLPRQNFQMDMAS
jgi:non-homologous end joining protein Ku